MVLETPRPLSAKADAHWLIDCSEGPARGAVLGGFRWWRNEETEANVFALTDADTAKFQEYLIAALYSVGGAADPSGL